MKNRKQMLRANLTCVPIMVASKESINVLCFNCYIFKCALYVLHYFCAIKVNVSMQSTLVHVGQCLFSFFSSILPIYQTVHTPSLNM